MRSQVWVITVRIARARPRSRESFAVVVHVDRWTALRLRIAVDRIRFDVGTVLDQAVEDVDGFMNAARDELAEQRDVHVGHVVVADPAVSAITNVVFGQQVLLVQAPLGAVRRRALAAAPVFRQRELVVRVDHVRSPCRAAPR